MRDYSWAATPNAIFVLSGMRGPQAETCSTAAVFWTADCSAALTADLGGSAQKAIKGAAGVQAEGLGCGLLHACLAGRLQTAWPRTTRNPRITFNYVGSTNQFDRRHCWYTIRSAPVRAPPPQPTGTEHQAGPAAADYRVDFSRKCSPGDHPAPGGSSIRAGATR